MAFNPLSNFHKYRQFWMASVLLLTMITFVFCGGKGMLDERFQQWFGWGGGTKLFSIDGSNYNDRELRDISQRRKLASIYMLRASDVCRNNLLALADNADAEFKAGAANRAKEELVEHQNKINGMRTKAALLYNNSKKVNYFDGGTNFDDLVDFLLLLKQADRLGVDLTDRHVSDFVHIDLHAGEAQFRDTESAYVLQEARSRSGMDRASESTLSQALRDEYRVKVTQLVLSKAPNLFSKMFKDIADLPAERRAPLTPAQLWDYFKQNRSTVDIALVPIEVRDFVTMPSDLQQFLTENRQDLNKLYEDHKRVTSDPASDTPGFELERRLKIEYVTADAKSKHYQRVTQAALLMQTSNPANFFPGLGTNAWVPLALGEPLLDVRGAREFEMSLKQRNLHTGAAWDQADIATAMVMYRGLRDPQVWAAWVGQGAAPFAVLLPDNGLSGMLAAAHALQGKKVEHAVKEEARRRAPVFAAMTTLAASGSPYVSLDLLRRMEVPIQGFRFGQEDFETPYLPLSLYRDEALRKLQEKMAQEWVTDNMITLRDALATSKAKGKLAVERVLNEYADKFGLERVKTDKFYGRYTLAQAPELAPFVDSFKKNYNFVNLIEGRTGPKALKEDDFYKLFESGEPFAPVEKYEAKAWPPDLRIKANTSQRNMLEQELRTLSIRGGKANPLFRKRLDEVQANNPVHMQRETTFPLFRLGQGKPVVYWKTEEESAKVPASLDVVKERVVEAYLTQRARDAKALPKAIEVAEALQKTVGNFSSELVRLNKVLGREPIRLYNVAPLVPEDLVIAEGIAQGFPPFEQRTYNSYKLPADAIPYPREDTVANLLQLYNLKKPFETWNDTTKTGFKELDEANKKLFEAMAKAAAKGEDGNRFVQIITNKPRTTFYVAMVTGRPNTNTEEFRAAWAGAKQFQVDLRGAFTRDREGPIGPRDTLVDRAQDQAATEFRQKLMQQLRDDLKYRPIEEKEGRKLFDHGDGG